MLSTSDIRSLTSLSKDARQAVAGAFDALAQWRKEVEAANQRYLKKALDRMAKAQQAMGWPERVTAAVQEGLIEASKAQTRMIDEIVEAWEQQLRSSRDPAGVPKTLTSPMAVLQRRPVTDPVSDMMRMGEMALVPFKLWIQAAEAWQRNWTTVVSAPAGRRPEPRLTKRPDGRPGRTRSR